jgi:Concanavalin A-like lectin/glucanases superfamily
MAYNFNGSNQYLKAAAPVTAMPLTIAFWFKKASTTAKNGVFLRNGANNEMWGIYFTSTARVYTQSGGSVGDVAATANFVVGDWHHACAIFPSATSRTIYLDAGNSANNTVNISPTGINDLWIGTNNAAANFDGDLAEVGVWTSALSLPEITSLSKGMQCNLVSPQSLAFYSPLIRNLTDIRGGLAITNFNSSTVSVHPRIY